MNEHDAYEVPGIGMTVCYIGYDGGPRPAIVQGPGFEEGGVALLIFPGVGETMGANTGSSWQQVPYRTEYNVLHKSLNGGNTTNCWLYPDEAVAIR